MQLIVGAVLAFSGLLVVVGLLGVGGEPSAFAVADDRRVVDWVLFGAVVATVAGIVLAVTAV